MENQEVKLNKVQSDICDECHFVVEADGDDVVVTDQDPVIAAKAKKAKKAAKFPQYAGARRDLNKLIAQAKAKQQERNGVSNVMAFPEEIVDPIPEAVVEVAPEPVVEVVPEPVPEVPVAPRVVPLRRAVITEVPEVLTNVVLDESNKKVRKTKSVSKKRDNRYARAFRTLLENPDLTVAEQAAIADVSYDMFVWYDITFRHMYRIIAEKYGDVLPPLPKLKK